MKLLSILKYLLMILVSILAAVGLFFIVFLTIFYYGANEGTIWIESSPPDPKTGKMIYRCGKRENGKDIEIPCEKYPQLQKSIEENINTP